MTVQRLTGDALETIRSLDTNTVDLLTSSPPFLALRNYNDLDGQWGSEPTPADFLDRLLELATESRRVLTPTGSMAIELGDTYSGSGGAGGDYDRLGMRAGQPKANGSARAEQDVGLRKKRTRTPDLGWPLSKSLTGIPTLYAWSLAYGRNLLNPQHEFEPWRIRNVIVWARNNPPVGALGDKVRPATSYITVACPSGKRWFDLDAVRTNYSPNSHARTSGATQQRTAKTPPDGNRDTLADVNNNGVGAPPTDHWIDEYDGDLTWLVNTAGSSLAHYAMWPARLAERLVLSMCPAEVCTVCQEPRRRITRDAPAYAALKADRGTWQSGGQSKGHAKPASSVGWDDGTPITAQSETLGWSDCEHGSWRNGHVLDPFSGTGTTLATADIHGRDATGIDLDPANRDLYERRYTEVWRNLKPDAGTSPVTEHGTQGALPL